MNLCPSAGNKEEITHLSLKKGGQCYNIPRDKLHDFYKMIDTDAQDGFCNYFTERINSSSEIMRFVLELDFTSRSQMILDDIQSIVEVIQTICLRNFLLPDVSKCHQQTLHQSSGKVKTMHHHFSQRMVLCRQGEIVNSNHL